MIRAIFWKEWREHRWKYATYWLGLNLPILLAALAVTLSVGARAPFGDLSDGTALKYLGVALVGESGFLATIFLVATGFLAVATFSPELEDGSVFYLYEQPLSRGWYVAMKLLNGAFHTVLAIAFAVLFAPLAAYGLMLAGGKVTVAGSMGTLAAVMAAAARAAGWCSLISLVAFTASALVAALAPRWWMATAASVVLIVVFGMAGDSFFDFIQPAFDAMGDGQSVSIGFGSPQWLTITQAIPLHAFAPWRALPLLTAVLLTAALAVATGLLYTRKELK